MSYGPTQELAVGGHEIHCRGDGGCFMPYGPTPKAWQARAMRVSHTAGVTGALDALRPSPSGGSWGPLTLTLSFPTTQPQEVCQSDDAGRRVH